ncbi:hypothetical protein AbraIFM66951_000274 [Aspergillus brasiliensis]|uniref:PPPDE domain-containing protein n=1 Tax=Aspergillus brasiliensis TaxID=319629 RepID=A0A9W5YE66_9EURO|nr:hypothetical protein AbraCBS73388_000073 [Aspergillus brasiliensis]GKZ40505.1 hypothetical protein AbraIFM66951_000274 [Aspergillus brasiliensis]
MSSLFFSDKWPPLMPLHETNPFRQPRPVFIDVRTLNGNIGKLLRAIRKNLPLEATVRTSHWGLRVGHYNWEIVTDSKNQQCLMWQRLTGSQILAPDVGVQFMGYTRCADADIESLAHQAYYEMRKRGGYNVVTNNCHLFVRLLTMLMIDLDIQYIHYEAYMSQLINKKLFQHMPQFA